LKGFCGVGLTVDRAKELSSGVGLPESHPDTEKDHLAECRAAPAAAGMAARPLKILVVEDNPVNQKLVRIQLNRLGYATDLAANGLQALSALKAGVYDVVLMDCQMPELDGYQATVQIRASQEVKIQPWIIAVTASAMMGDRERCMEAGMDEYLTKPVDPDLLKAMLERRAGTAR
jgi:CheY-like chemotaxis protein